MAAVFAKDHVMISRRPITGPLFQATRTVPIVFLQVADSIGDGFVESLSVAIARPKAAARIDSTAREYSV
jgi:hypothetical protein